MQVEFLGTSGFHPTERRHTSCVFLPEAGIVFDAGTGIFRLPKRLKTTHLNIVLSHSHLDHVVGLTYLLPHIAEGTLESASVIASPQTIQNIREHLFSPALFPVRVPYEFIEMTEPRQIGDARLSYRDQEHPGGSRGYRLDWPDRSLAYVTDTRVDLPGLEFLRRVDLAIHECTYRDEYQELADLSGHCTTTAVCSMARDAGVKRLILTHFDPYLDLEDPVDLEKAHSIFPGAEAAYDGFTVDF